MDLLPQIRSHVIATSLWQPVTVKEIVEDLKLSTSNEVHYSITRHLYTLVEAGWLQVSVSCLPPYAADGSEANVAIPLGNIIDLVVLDQSEGCLVNEDGDDLPPQHVYMTAKVTFQRVATLTDLLDYAEWGDTMQPPDPSAQSVIDGETDNTCVPKPSFLTKLRYDFDKLGAVVQLLILGIVLVVGGLMVEYASSLAQVAMGLGGILVLAGLASLAEDSRDTDTEYNGE